MSVFLCCPSLNLQTSTEEYRAKGLIGTKCPPSQSPAFLVEPVFACNRGDYIKLRWLRATPEIEGGSTLGNYKIADIQSLPDFPLPLPKLVFASTKGLSKETQEALTVRKYLAGRSKFSHVYTLTTPTNIERLRAIGRRGEVDDTYVPPSGFITPSSANALVLLRKIVYAGIATLPIEGYDFGSACGLYSSDYLTFTWAKIVVEPSKGIEEDTTVDAMAFSRGGLPQGIAPREVPNMKDRGYLFLAYFKGSAGSDKKAIRDFCSQMAPMLKKDVSQAIQGINALMQMADKGLEGEQGRVLGHIAQCGILLANAGMFGQVVVAAGEYIGMVAYGSTKSFALNAFGHVVPSVSFDEVTEIIGKASTSQAAKERLAQLLSDLELDDDEKEGEEDKVEVDERALTSSYRIWWELKKRATSFESSANHMATLSECLSVLDFSEDTRKSFIPEGFKAWLSDIVEDSYPYEEEEQMKDKYMNILGIKSSFGVVEASQGVFGGVAYSPVWPGGKKFVIPAPGAPDSYTKPKDVLVKKGDSTETIKMTELESLVFIRCTPLQAAKDWNQVLKSGAIWQPSKVLTRKEKTANVIWSGESMTNAWNTLKELCHKPEKKGEPAAKKQKTEETKAKGPDTVDISQWKAW